MENQGQYGGGNKSVVSVGDWMVTILIMCLPVVNLIMLCIWAFGSSTAESKSNWAKAALIWMAISIVITIMLWGTIAAMIAGSMR